MDPEQTSADRLRQHMRDASSADPAVGALVEECCRILDRLDQIDGIVTGKTEWIQLMHFRVGLDDEQTVIVTIDGVLAEARQQVTALKGLYAQLGIGKADLSGKAAKAVDPLDELAARRTARGGATARLGRAQGRSG